MKGIILTAAKAESSLIQIFGDVPTGIVPVNGKPIIFYIIENLLKFGVSEIYIAIGYKKDLVKRIVDTYFSKKIKIIYVEVDGSKLPGSSLLKVFSIIKSGRVIINLADTYTYLDNRIIENCDCILTSTNYYRPKLWCTVLLDQDRNVLTFTDKQENIRSEEVVIGIYIINNIEIITTKFKNEDSLQISDLLEFYLTRRKIVAICSNEWLDFGHIDKYQVSKKRLLESRIFNTLNFDDTLGTITKTSNNKEKFINEIEWQLRLPKKLKILFPRIIDYDLTSKSPFLTMEYYSYSTVAEIWLYSEFKMDVIKILVDKVINILGLFYGEKREVNFEDYERIYKLKTLERIQILLKESSYFQKLFSFEELIINNRPQSNWNAICDRTMERCNDLFSVQHNCLIHGDYCFSNILYDINSGVIRLIDPRGVWDKNGNGDIKYDIAKIRHSIHGGYDFIVNDLFSVKVKGNIINYNLFGYDKYLSAIEYYDSWILKEFDINQIKLIEGLLFLSMLPLHSNSLERQIVMFAKAIELLNEVA